MTNWNAFVPGERICINGKKGPLTGMTFASKDLFDIEGTVTGNGCREWRSTHKNRVSENAEVIDQLLNAGAKLTGRTVMDAMAWGAQGGDSDDPNPINPKFPDRATGGSSSGSAVAVAAGLVDFAIGSDTACSVRLPSTYCGIWGFRPTHGIISTKGMTPLAPSMDTVGWMARSHEVLELVSNILLPENLAVPPNYKILLVAELIEWMPEPTRTTFNAIVKEMLDGMEEEYSEGRIDVHEGLKLFWFRAWSLEIMEAAEIYGPWITGQLTDSKFKAAVVEGLKATIEDNKKTRDEFNRKEEEIRSFLANSRVLCLPTVLDVPPLLNGIESRSILPDFCGLSIATLAGLPQITIPLANDDGLPFGLSLIGPQGSDRDLIKMAERLTRRD